MTALGLNRISSAAYIGIGTTMFDSMVADGRMPKPHVIGSRKVWDRRELETSFEELPREGYTKGLDNSWDS